MVTGEPGSPVDSKPETPVPSAPESRDNSSTVAHTASGSSDRVGTTHARVPDTLAAQQPNRLFRWLFRRYFSHIEVDPRWGEVVRDAADRGSVVYVMRAVSLLDFLCLDYLTRTFALPLVRFVNNLGSLKVSPSNPRSRFYRWRGKDAGDGDLRDTLSQNDSALMFLRRPPGLFGNRRKGRALAHDPLRLLVRTQRGMSRPLMLVPQTFVWGKLPGNQEESLWSLLLGSSDWPGRVRTFFRFLMNYRNAVLRASAPFNLGEFVHEHRELDDEELANKVGYALLSRMERERGLVLGPVKKSPHRLREEILRSHRLRKHIDSVSRGQDRTAREVEREVNRELKKLCASPEPYVLEVLKRGLDHVWNRIYDGVVVDQEGLERVRDAARKGPLVLLPSHKSHVDYLVLSHVFYTHQLSPPLIAAGDNLSFWPLGSLLKRAGAFFIRRSFKGRKLYSALVDTYIRKVLLEGHHVELFIEGGRSRTGKLLAPKFGILSMIVDACLALPNRNIHFVPISLGYELIVEQQSYVDELTGADKQQENIGGLLKTPEVLRSRYGRLYIQFGEVTPFERMRSEALASAPTRASRTSGVPGENGARFTPAARRNLIQKIGHQAVYEINRVTMVTPAALAAISLMSHRRRGVRRSSLESSMQSLRDTLIRVGARLARPISREDWLTGATIDEALRLLEDGKLVTTHGEERDTIYTIPEERRIALEYYKNNIVHFFVPYALISSALKVDGGEPISEELLRERVKRLSRLFKYEFMYRADTDYDQIFDDALRQMIDSGEIERLVDRIHIGHGRSGARVSIYSNMIRTYFEAYLLAARGLSHVNAGPMSQKEWVRRTLALGQRMYLAGELEHRESLSKHKLENATLALRDYGLAKVSSNGQISLTPAAPGAPVDQALRLEKRILRYLL